MYPDNKITRTKVQYLTVSQSSCLDWTWSRTTRWSRSPHNVLHSPSIMLCFVLFGKLFGFLLLNKLGTFMSWIYLDRPQFNYVSTKCICYSIISYMGVATCLVQEHCYHNKRCFKTVSVLYESLLPPSDTSTSIHSPAQNYLKEAGQQRWQRIGCRLHEARNCPR